MLSRWIRGIPKIFERRHLKLWRFYSLLAVGRVLFPKYRFQWPQMDWWDDPDFNGYLERFGEMGWLNTDRRWTLSQLLRLTADVPGDTAECGVFKGASSYLICSANSRSARERWHFVFDSFEGLSSPTEADGEFWQAGDLTVSEGLVAGNLSEFPNVSLHKGWIPDRFTDVEDRRFSFVHVDVDIMEPTRDSVAFFYPRLNDGGILLCDDYACTTCPGATASIDEYLRDKPEKMLALTAGGGFLVKGSRTGDGYR